MPERVKYLKNSNCLFCSWNCIYGIPWFLNFWKDINIKSNDAYVTIWKIRIKEIWLVQNLRLKYVQNQAYPRLSSFPLNYFFFQINKTIEHTARLPIVPREMLWSSENFLKSRRSYQAAIRIYNHQIRQKFTLTQWRRGFQLFKGRSRRQQWQGVDWNIQSKDFLKFRVPSLKTQWGNNRSDFHWLNKMKPKSKVQLLKKDWLQEGRKEAW